MNSKWTPVARWTPRILGLLFALFISIFALDVFGEGYSIWQTIVALFMHLLPVFVLLIGLALAWRWEWVGAVAFMGFCLWYVADFSGSFPWPVYVLMVGLPFLIGMLFLFDWVYLPRQGTPAS